jgi:hypothetical protein
MTNVKYVSSFHQWKKTQGWEGEKNHQGGGQVVQHKH